MARNRVRLWLLPELEQYNPALRDTLRRAARACTDDAAYLESQVTEAWPTVVGEVAHGALTLDRAGFRRLHPAIQRGVLREALARLWGGWQDFGWDHVEALRNAAVAGRVGSQMHLPHGLVGSVGYDGMALGSRVAAAAEPGDAGLLLRPGQTIALALPGISGIPGSGWELAAGEATADDLQAARAHAVPAGSAVVDAATVDGQLFLRTPRPGDRLEPLGMGGSKKLQDLLVDAKVPREIRSRVPVLAGERGVVWVAGRWLARWAAVTPETEHGWTLRFRTAAEAGTPGSAPLP